MKKIKIGVVPYMNAKPLIYGLENNSAVELLFDFPALLTEMLSRGMVDVALVPSIEYFLNSHLLIIPNIAIASHGEVKSVKLLVRNPYLSLRGVSSNVIARSVATWQSCSKGIASPSARNDTSCEIPRGVYPEQENEILRYAQNDKSAFHPENIKTVALDIASNTSKVLSRIIMNEKYHLDPDFTTWNPSEENLDAQADAFLVIGDNALKTNDTNCFTIDLGKEWHDMTHLPFVYAFWATKRKTKIPGIRDILYEAKTKGLGKLEELAAKEAKRLGLTFAECFNYLSKNICYNLGEKELTGLKTFYRYATKMGLVKEGIDIEFYNA